MLFEKAREKDSEAVSALYDAVSDYLEAHVNYPNWKKGEYPTREDAEAGLRNGELYVCREENTVIGTLKLSHTPEAGYAGAPRSTPDDYGRILVLYTPAVLPACWGKGAAKVLPAGAERFARETGCVAMRLDSVAGNIPAKRLYESCGFAYVGTKSLGYEKYGLLRFDLYEKVLE